MFFWLSLFFVITFAIIHFFSKYMTFLSEIPRSRYLSVAGGISVSYVFLHLLPELKSHHNKINRPTEGIIEPLLQNAYLMALAGFFVFYALDQIVKSSRKGKVSASNRNIFWIHIAAFFLYNALIGYLLVREEFHEVSGITFYFIAMVVHFITVDHNLRADHQETYDRYGRWLLTSSIILGWVAGRITEISEYVLSLLVAFLAGGIILNVIKEEIPEERDSSIGAFAVGMAFYSIILLLME